MKNLICLAVLLGFVTLGVAHKAPKNLTAQSGKSALQSMVDAELAFAKMSEEQGTRPSFMAFIADDGILFRPRAVKGKQWMSENPVPPSDMRPLLSWYPTFADIARAGDMGYTYGPWEYKTDIRDAKPVAFGNFLTVWKRQADGSWKFAIDLGVSNPQPDNAPALWQLPKNYKAPKAMKGFWTFSVSALLDRDRVFSKASAMQGARKTFNDYAAEDVRVFRNAQQPSIGRTLAAAALPASPLVWTWEPAFADVSQSDDLGYSYGSYQVAKNDATVKTEKVETGNYFRVWRKKDNKWRVVADLTDPVAEDKKN